MHWDCKRLLFSLAAWALVGLGVRAQEPVTYKIVKYDGLAQAIQQQKGKVLVVDIWAEW